MTLLSLRGVGQVEEFGLARQSNPRFIGRVAILVFWLLTDFENRFLNWNKNNLVNGLPAGDRSTGFRCRCLLHPRFVLTIMRGIGQRRVKEALVCCLFEMF